MSNEPEREPTLAEIEEEVLAEGREWMRQRLQQKLQERADGISQNFSPQGKTSGALSKNSSVTFHYLSASPSQLFTPLSEFIVDHNFPPGSFHLRAFDWRKEFQNHSVPKKHKPAVLEAFMKKFPKRRFILVGDSGESDPEIYADLTRKFPERVERILIRDVTGETAEAPRYKEAFTTIDAAKWSVFKDPTEIAGFRGVIEKRQ